MGTDFEALYARCEQMHKHLCPRQILGVRIGVVAGRALGADLPQTGKRLIGFVETDGCFADGVSVATGCWFGRRTLRLMDQGKVALTLADSSPDGGEPIPAVRVRPKPDLRARVTGEVSGRRWPAYMDAYRTWPDAELFDVRPVRLGFDLAALISHQRAREICAVCGEEILNERQVLLDGRVSCLHCAGEGYWS